MTNETVYDRAYYELESELSEPVLRVLRWLRQPDVRWFRIATGCMFLVGSAFAFLPVLGLEMLPIGLLLLAEDIPLLREPIGHATLFCIRHWRAFKHKVGAWVSAKSRVA